MFKFRHPLDALEAGPLGKVQHIASKDQGRLRHVHRLHEHGFSYTLLTTINSEGGLPRYTAINHIETLFKGHEIV